MFKGIDNLFTIKKSSDRSYKLIQILGLEIKIKIKKTHEQCFNELWENFLYSNQRLLTASIVNQKAFAKYKGCNRGKNVVSVAAGPTVNSNRAFLFDKINFDFLLKKLYKFINGNSIISFYRNTWFY